jgi:hypothetical protein
VGLWTAYLSLSRGMYGAVSWLRRLVAGISPRRPGFNPGSVHVGFVVDKVALGQVFPPSTSVFPCQFHSTDAPLLVKMNKKLIIFHLRHRVAQEALRLRCVHSICCGALHHKKRGMYSVQVTCKRKLLFFVQTDIKL